MHHHRSSIQKLGIFMGLQSSRRKNQQMIEDVSDMIRQKRHPEINKLEIPLAVSGK
jgi:hypothetical protein